MIRLGVCLDTFELGGFELACLELLRRLDLSRVAPLVYTFRPGTLVAEAEAFGIPVRVAHDKPRSDRTWTAPDSRAREAYLDGLAHALREDRISMVLVWGWIDGVAAGVRAGIPAIVERVDGPSLAARIRDKSACARIVCESEAVARVIRAQRGILGVDLDRLVVIPNGIDLESFDPVRIDRTASRAALGLDEHDFVIGAVARLSREKNLDLLVDALELMSVRGTVRDRPVRLVLAGPDEGEGEAIMQRARDLGVDGSVRSLGARRDVARILAAFDVFCMPSLYEGSPFALLEAMAMGLPVICTPVGAVPEMVDGNGYLVPPLDPGPTAAAIRELLADEGLRRRLGAQSRRLAERHAIGTMVDAYAGLLEEVHAETIGVAA